MIPLRSLSLLALATTLSLASDTAAMPMLHTLTRCFISYPPAHGEAGTRLESTGQVENTWIFFTADHGLACGHHGLMGKQNMYEHTIEVPLIVSGPGWAV